MYQWMEAEAFMAKSGTPANVIFATVEQDLPAGNFPRYTEPKS